MDNFDKMVVKIGERFDYEYIGAYGVPKKVTLEVKEKELGPGPVWPGKGCEDCFFYRFSPAGPPCSKSYLCNKVSLKNRRIIKFVEVKK